VLKGVLGIIMNTVVSSSRTAVTAQPKLIQQPPDEGSGIVQGKSTFDPDDHPDILP
jgi:hypothetical protein